MGGNSIDQAMGVISLFALFIFVIMPLMILFIGVPVMVICGYIKKWLKIPDPLPFTQRYPDYDME